jgi:hypothetical protein
MIHTLPISIPQFFHQPDVREYGLSIVDLVDVSIGVMDDIVYPMAAGMSIQAFKYSFQLPVLFSFCVLK